MNIKEIIRIIRELAVIVVLIIIGYKFASTGFTIDVGTLRATDIVALLMAFFAVGLSAAFYFKGSEASNLFYDNMHKFTQDTSVILGKIESKFSEQLKNIEQRSADLKVSVDKYYSNSNNEASDEKKEQAESQVNKSKEQYEELIESIFSKVKIDETEKSKLKSELQRSEEELRSLESSLVEIERGKIEKFKPRLRRYLERRLYRALTDKELIDLKPKELFLNILRNGVSQFVNDMKSAGFITNSNLKSTDEITKSGMEFFMATLDKVISEFDEES